MKRIIQTVVVGVLLSAAQGALAESPFPAAAESNVGQPALESYAQHHAREGTLLVGSGSAFPVAAETSVGQPALDTYADSNAKNGGILGSSESPFPLSGDVDMRRWSYDPRDIA